MIRLENKGYYVSKSKKKKDTMYLEYDKLDGYKVNPKTNPKGGIEVSKIVFVNPEFSEKIIRKKIDKKIEELLKQLNDITDGTDSSEGAIKRSLMDAEKLRMQIITNYVKYLGHTYEGLTLKKIQLIMDSLRERLYLIKTKELMGYYAEEKEEQRRGR